MAKRREQPWMAAARARLHKQGAPKREEPPAPAPAHGPQPKWVRVYANRTNRADPPSEAEVVGDALLEMAAPDIAALGPRRTHEQIDLIVEAAMYAYNQPLREADGIPGMPFLGPLLRNSLNAMCENFPGFRARYERMLKVRTERFGHLTTHVMMYRGGVSDQGVYVELMLPPEADLPDA